MWEEGFWGKIEKQQGRGKYYELVIKIKVVHG